MQIPIPIWIGGNAKLTLRRVAEQAQGWMPLSGPAGMFSTVRSPEISSTDDFVDRLEMLKEYAGDRFAELDIAMAYTDDARFDLTHRRRAPPRQPRPPAGARRHLDHRPRPHRDGPGRERLPPGLRGDLLRMSDAAPADIVRLARARTPPGSARSIRTDARFEPFIGYRPPNLEHSAAHLAGLQALLFDAGWSRLGWPESAGGLGGDPRFRAALFQTLWDHDIQIPEPFCTLEILVPVLLVFAPHLADELLPGLLRGDDTWAQAFSEPDAGSDMASLRTRMEPDGDGYRLYGQKVWSTFGHLSQRSILLARSGGPGHKGLTMVLIDLDQDGADVRPIRAQDGDNHFSEIFLDGAYVPKERVIGELGQGWAVAMYMLQWERGAWGWLQQGRFHKRLEQALGMAPPEPRHAASIGHAYTLDVGAAPPHPQHRRTPRPRGAARPGGLDRQAAPDRRRDRDVERDPRARRATLRRRPRPRSGCATSTCSAGPPRSTAARSRSSAPWSPSACSACRESDASR